MIYTTGSTGFPKPALLSHRNITAQNLCLAGGCDWFDIRRMLVNLPPSHVGCQGEELMTTFFAGGTAVILSRFDAEKSLQAIERYKVESIGQIPVDVSNAVAVAQLRRLRLELAAQRDVRRATGDATVRAAPV